MVTYKPFLKFSQFYVFYYVLIHYFVMTKFCPWARWGGINPLIGGFCRRVGSRSDLCDAVDKSFLHHLISVQGSNFIDLMGCKLLSQALGLIGPLSL